MNWNKTTMKIHIFKYVTQPRLLDAEATGSTFPQSVCIYWQPQHIITQDLNLYLHSCQNQTP